MPGCDLLRCKLSCNAQVHSPLYRIDSLKSVRPTMIPSVDSQCCGARRNRRSIASEEIDTMMGATRRSISAYPLVSPTSGRLKNLLQHIGLPDISSIALVPSV